MDSDGSWTACCNDSDGDRVAPDHVHAWFQQQANRFCRNETQGMSMQLCLVNLKLCRSVHVYGLHMPSFSMSMLPHILWQLALYTTLKIHTAFWRAKVRSRKVYLACNASLLRCIKCRMLLQHLNVGHTEVNPVNSEPHSFAFRITCTIAPGQLGASCRDKANQVRREWLYQKNV